MIICYKSPKTDRTYVFAVGTLHGWSREEPYKEFTRENGMPKLTFKLCYDYERENEGKEKKYKFHTANCAFYGNTFSATMYTLAKSYLKSGARLIVTGVYSRYPRIGQNGESVMGEEIMVDSILPIEALSALLIRFESDMGDYYVRKKEMLEQTYNGTPSESDLSIFKSIGLPTNDEYDFD